MIFFGVYLPTYIIIYTPRTRQCSAAFKFALFWLYSAGVGRTGCYIVLDAMMRQIASRGDVNVFSYLKHIRRQRNHLVQTEEQYVFIHDALAEAVEGGETHIGKGCLPRYIHSLQCVDLTDEKSHSNKLLEKQYRVSE